MLSFIAYYLWIILGILLLIFVKLCMYEEYTGDIKFKGYIYLLYLISIFIPVWNMFTVIISSCFCFDVFEIKIDLIDKIKKFWIIKVLTKEY